MNSLNLHTPEEEMGRAAQGYKNWGEVVVGHDLSGDEDGPCRKGRVGGERVSQFKSFVKKTSDWIRIEHGFSKALIRIHLILIRKTVKKYVC
jgi:hypothetical protein